MQACTRPPPSLTSGHCFLMSVLQALAIATTFSKAALQFAKSSPKCSIRQSLTLSWPAHFDLMSATHALTTGFTCSARIAEYETDNRVSAKNIAIDSLTIRPIVILSSRETWFGPLRVRTSYSLVNVTTEDSSGAHKAICFSREFVATDYRLPG